MFHAITYDTMFYFNYEPRKNPIVNLDMVSFIVTNKIFMKNTILISVFIIAMYFLQRFLPLYALRLML